MPDLRDLQRLRRGKLHIGGTGGCWHTFATNCIAKGMNPKTLQKLLGHNSLQMTMNLYCRVLDETLKEEMANITDMV